MADKDINEEILENIGGKSQNNLNEILRNFTDTDFEVKTFDDSSYIDIDSMTDNLKPHEKSFSLMSLNIQSINAKFDKLTTLSSYLNESNFMFSAICIQETWLRHDQDTSLFEIPGYNLIHKGKSCSEHGGLIIYLKEEFTYNYRKLYNQSNLWEGLFIDVFNEHINKKITIGNIYRPPKFNNSNPTIEDFMLELNPVIDKLSNENSYAIFTGDFNINLLEINTRLKYQAFFDLFVTQSFYPKIVQPTRFTKKKGSILDNIFCKLNENMSKSYSGILLSHISDHLPIFTCLDIYKSNKQKRNKYIMIEKQDKDSIKLFHDDIESSLKNIQFPNDLTTDPNLTKKMLEQVISSAKEKHLTPKKVKFNHYKHKKNPWITKGILNSIKFRDKLYKKTRLTDPGSIKYETLHENLKAFNSILQRNINQAKKSYYDDKFKRYITNMKKTWTTINEILSKSNNKKEFPSYFTMKDKKISDKQDIANQFNTFFANIGPDLSKKIPRHQDKSMESYLKENILCSFNFELIEQDTVKKIIKILNAKHSSGHDNVSTISLKEISPLISSPLTLILNQSLTTGIFPDKLKIAKIIPLFKKDDPHYFDNYRPISLLPAISKVFEKAVFIQLYDYINENELFYKSQYGFRTLHSTETASLEITDIITKELDRGKLPIGIFLDLSKAFDTLDHNILLKKLKHYGIRDTELKWFKSYLTNRTQYVSFDGIHSSMLPITTGVPQGSILGPLLFIIYMNDIHRACKHFHPILFADDTNLTSSLCSFNEEQNTPDRMIYLSQVINNELKEIQKWLELNKLSLNVKKTKYMIFHNHQRDIINHTPK